jgi:beta-lactamase class A
MSGVWPAAAAFAPARELSLPGRGSDGVHGGSDLLLRIIVVCQAVSLRRLTNVQPKRNATGLTQLAFLSVVLLFSQTLDALAAGEEGLPPRKSIVLDEIAAIERTLGASVGLYVRDVDSGELLTHSADVRFPLNSTFKLFACAALLKRVEVGTSSLDDQVPIGRQQLVSWSPVVERMLDEDRSQMSTDELCAATLSVSDNTAANLILGEIGGPLGFTSYMRGLGDQVTRLDRCEPELNEGLADDPRDTTTPRAIGKSIEKLLLGNQLMPSSRVKLQGWLEGHRMAGDLFRSGLPENWSIYDRSGAGGNGTRGIVSVVYRPTRGPLVAVMYLRDARVSLAERNAAIARVGRTIFEHFGPE